MLATRPDERARVALTVSDSTPGRAACQVAPDKSCVYMTQLEAPADHSRPRDHVFVAHHCGIPDNLHLSHLGPTYLRTSQKIDHACTLRTWARSHCGTSAVKVTKWSPLLPRPMLAKWPPVGRGFEALVRAGLVRQGTVGNQVRSEQSSRSPHGRSSAFRVSPAPPALWVAGELWR